MTGKFLVVKFCYERSDSLHISQSLATNYEKSRRSSLSSLRCLYDMRAAKLNSGHLTPKSFESVMLYKSNHESKK